MGTWMHPTGWGWMLGWHLLGWALLVAALVAIVVAMIRTGGRDRRGDAERILAERYARGEIDTEEYRSRGEALRCATSGGGSCRSPWCSRPGCRSCSSRPRLARAC